MAPNFKTKELNDMAAAIERKSKGVVSSMGHCGSCGTPIFWVKMPSGKNAPWDQKPYEKDGQPVNHFGTCPNAQRHRPAKEGGTDGK